jgi:hypothetical protein
MSRLNILKLHNSYLTILVLLLLILVPAQRSWCFQDGEAVIVPDTLIADCHSVPSVCLTSASMLIEQGKATNPADCNECFDLSFEEVASLCLQDRISDTVFAPGTSFCQPPPLLFGEASHSHSFISYVKRPLKANLNLHGSIPSTVLII